MQHIRDYGKDQQGPEHIMYVVGSVHDKIQAGAIPAVTTGSRKHTTKGIANMLVLSRHIGESIMLGDDMKVVVLSIKGDKVRLGIEAPDELPVHRTEIYRKIQEEKQDDND